LLNIHLRVTTSYCGWFRNPAPVDRWFIPLFIGFQTSFWWCRISQPSTVLPAMLVIHRPTSVETPHPTDFGGEQLGVGDCDARRCKWVLASTTPAVGFAQGDGTSNKMIYIIYIYI